MIYEVYSYSDATLIGDVLNNISMLMTSKAYFNAIRLGLLLGILVTSVRYFFTKTFDLHYILISCVIFQVLFVPTGTVSIEDVKTAKVIKVDHVPLGIAASMYLTSSLGNIFTSTYDTAFQTVDSSYPTGYMSPLRDLLAARKLTNASLNVEQSQNWANYFKSCVIPYEDVIFSTKEIFGGDNILASLATENQNVFVSYSENGKATLKSCKDAYTKNKADAEKTYTNAFLPKIQNIYGTEDTDTAQTQLEDAIKYIPALKHTEVTAQQFMLNLWLSKVALLSGELQYDAEIAGGAYGPAILEAIEQRNVDAAAYGSMFGQSMPYLMAGIEIIAYGLTPMAGFLLVLGPFGMRLVMRWLLLPLWVGMWPPLTTLINWFMLKVTSHQLSTISDPISFYGSQHLYSVLSNWYGIAGTLQGLVPAISMTFLTGSYFAFTSLANRFSETQTFDEKKLAPDLRNAPPVLQSQAPFSSDPSRGTHATGLPGTARYSISNAISHMKSSSISKLNASKEQLSSAQSELLQDTFTHNGAFSKEKNMAFNKQIEGSELESTIESQANNFAKTHSLTKTETEASRKLIGIGLTAGLGAMMRIAGEAKFQKIYGLELKQSKQLASTIGHSIQDNDQLQVKSATALNSLIKNGKLDSITHGQSSNKTKNFTSAYEQMISSVKRHENAENIAATVNTETTYDAAQLGNMLTDAEKQINPHRHLDRLYDRHIGDTRKIQQEENRVRYRFGLDQSMAHKVATWNLLSYASLSNPSIQDALSDYYQYGWGNSGAHTPHNIDASTLDSQVNKHINTDRNEVNKGSSGLAQTFNQAENKQNALWKDRDVMQLNLQNTFKNINAEKFASSLDAIENERATENFNNLVSGMVESQHSFGASVAKTLALPFQHEVNQHIHEYLANRDLQKDFGQYKEEAQQHGFSGDMSTIYAARQSLLSVNPESLNLLRSRYPNLHQEYQSAKQNLVSEYGEPGEKFIIATKLMDSGHMNKYFALAPKMLQNIDKNLKAVKTTMQGEQAKVDAQIINKLEDF